SHAGARPSASWPPSPRSNQAKFASWSRMAPPSKAPATTAARNAPSKRASSSGSWTRTSCVLVCQGALLSALLAAARRPSRRSRRFAIDAGCKQREQHHRQRGDEGEDEVALITEHFCDVAARRAREGEREAHDGRQQREVRGAVLTHAEAHQIDHEHGRPEAGAELLDT